MPKQIAQWGKQILQLALIVLVVSLAMDWWRKPAQPLDFANQPLTTLQGQTFTLNEFSRNRTAVLYFWGSWCSICKHTSPTIHRLHQAGVPVLGIAWQSGPQPTVAAYLRKHQWNFDSVNDPHGAITRQWHVKAAPTIVFVKNGQMVHTTTGLSSYWGLRLRLWLSNWS